jgi:hypothetical protein
VHSSLWRAVIKERNNVQTLNQRAGEDCHTVHWLQGFGKGKQVRRSLMQEVSRSRANSKAATRGCRERKKCTLELSRKKVGQKQHGQRLAGQRGGVPEDIGWGWRSEGVNKA